MIKKKILEIVTKIRKNDFDKLYSEIEKIIDKDELLKFQEKYLKKLLLHAYRNVPYYHKIFKKIGIVNGETVDLSRFNKIPLLTKQIIRKNKGELISRDYATRKWYYNTSGGSTGEPIRFIQDDVYTIWRNVALQYYYKNILGVDISSVKKIILWGSEKDLFQKNIDLKTKIVNWLTDTVFLNSFKMSETDMGRYIHTIDSYRPYLIRGYAGSLYDLCKYAERKNPTIYTPKILVSSAETLTSEMRQTIETVFGTKVYDFYGSREVSGIAGECKDSLMHVFTFYNYLEILDSNNRPLSEGKEGRIIVTNLHNYSMPLIRYDIGDMAVLGPEKCKCGNVLPTLKKVTGRITDHFVKEDGTIIRVPTSIFFFKSWIQAFQIIQEDYQKIKILIVLEGNINKDEKKDIEDKIKSLMGHDCSISWEFPEQIPREKSGKYLYRKSLVWGRV